MTKLRITWTRSTIGLPYPQRRVIQALGLRRLHHTVERMDTPSIRGMILKVQHLVKVEQVQEDGASEGAQRQA
ncbi:MAG: 50S ribosomal protein L30 [Dehalococcoidia bacterium]|nr:50S ribosomal protein L30 [Dehalococcoidia bacterium]